MPKSALVGKPSRVETEVESQLSFLTSQLNRVRDLLDQAGVRLSPVLRVVPEGSEKPLQGSDKSPCPLAEELFDKGRGFAAANRRLEELLDRLEI